MSCRQAVLTTTWGLLTRLGEADFCTTVNLHDVFYAVRNGVVEDGGRRCMGGRRKGQVRIGQSPL